MKSAAVVASVNAAVATGTEADAIVVATMIVIVKAAQPVVVAAANALLRTARGTPNAMRSVTRTVIVRSRATANVARAPKGMRRASSVLAVKLRLRHRWPAGR